MSGAEPVIDWILWDIRGYTPFTDPKTVRTNRTHPAGKSAYSYMQ